MQRVDLVATSDLPRISERGGARWNPSQGLQFGAHCLQYMMQAAARRPGRHLRFSYSGGGREQQQQLLLSWAELPGGELPARVRSCLEACGQLAATASK